MFNKPIVLILLAAVVLLSACGRSKPATETAASSGTPAPVAQDAPAPASLPPDQLPPKPPGGPAVAGAVVVQPTADATTFRVVAPENAPADPAALQKQQEMAAKRAERIRRAKADIAAYQQSHPDKKIPTQQSQ